MKVVFILCDRMLATSMTLPAELLLAAHAQAKSKYFSQKHSNKLTITTASESGKPVRTHTGITITPDTQACNIERADILYLPALWRNPLPQIQKSKHTLALIHKLHKQGTIIAGVGTGCCFIAETGLLDNKPATTHWYYFEHFLKRYPQVQLKRQIFITQAENIFCTASVNSLAELTTGFIKNSFSTDIALHVQRHFFHEIRQNLKSEHVYSGTSAGHTDEDIIQVQTWLTEHFWQTIEIIQLAQLFGMSVRTLNRRFKNATTMTPLNYLRTIRMDNARDLLKNTNLTITEIMENVGYQDPSHFNRIFKKQFGIKPSQYRTTIRGKVFNTH